MKAHPVHSHVTRSRKSKGARAVGSSLDEVKVCVGGPIGLEVQDVSCRGDKASRKNRVVVEGNKILTRAGGNGSGMYHLLRHCGPESPSTGGNPVN